MKTDRRLAGVTPRHEAAERDAFDARQLADRSRDLLVELPFPSRSPMPIDGVGRSTPAPGACCSRCRRVCNATSVASSVPAPASSTNENAICVVAKTRSRRFVPGVIRTLPLASAEARRGACADGSRGTYASSTAAAMARPAPTQSRLASTVTSSARTEKRAANAQRRRRAAAPAARPAPRRRRRARGFRRAASVEARRGSAPSAARTASSPSRRTDRARIRFATFEHAMTKTIAGGGEQQQQHRARRRRDLIAERRDAQLHVGVRRSTPPGCSRTIAACTAISSARASSTDAPGASAAEQLGHPMRALGDHRRAEVMRTGHDVRDDFGLGRIRHRRLEHADDRRGARPETDRLADHRRIALERRRPEAIRQHGGASRVGTVVSSRRADGRAPGAGP